MKKPELSGGHDPIMPVLEARNLEKTFGATRALVDGSVTINAGEVVALLGENGSGKSTLVKLLSGILVPDAGSLLLHGRPVRFSSARDALRAGIVTIFQEILVAPDLTVFENLWLGNGSPMKTKNPRRRRLASDVLDMLDPKFPDLDTPVHELDLMQRQVCVIARALLRKPRLLILDESTSTLDVALRDRLFESVRRSCEEGMAAVFISHRMDEVLSLADRFVGLRSGSKVGEMERNEASAEALISLISGTGVTSRSTGGFRGERAGTEIAIQIDDVRLRPGSSPLNLGIRRGEILGLAGLEGHGQDELLRAMAGLHAVHSGHITDKDGDVTIGYGDYAKALKRGIAYVPRDRKVDGLADILSVRDNYGLPTFDKDAKAGVVSYRKTKARLFRDAARVNFAPARQTAAGRLSGGNQQKVILARWLATNPKVILLNDPTRGVDLRTKRELYDLFRSLADDAVTIILLSTEVDELVSLADRVVVFHGGSTAAILEGGEVTTENLVSAYFGRIPVEGGSK